MPAFSNSSKRNPMLGYIVISSMRAPLSGFLIYSKWNAALDGDCKRANNSRV
jgi:hypothetical protein